jgi:cation:H+ antiporter
LVNESVWLATLLSLPQTLIGLSIIAIGTSLPELTVSITAAKKGQSKFVLGNVIGSNIANILLVCGVSGIISPIQIAEMSVVYTIPILLFFSLFLLFSIKSDWKIERKTGLMLVALYILFLSLAFIQGWS